MNRYIVPGSENCNADHAIKFPTVRIVDNDCAGGYRTINKSDLMPDDVLHVDPADEVHIDRAGEVQK